jgi:hypothetical protein
MRKRLASCLFALLFATPCLADQTIKVTGCVQKGIEVGCLLLRTITGKTYNISAASPTPILGTYGQVVGTLRSGAVSFCMQGAVIEPAAWTKTGQFCPKRMR